MQRNVKARALTLLIIGAVAGAAYADSAGVVNPDVDREILNELRQIRILLENQARDRPTRAAQPSTQATFDVGSAPFLGSEKAPITIIEFTDFQCPYCRRFQEQTFPQLKRNFIDTGAARFYSLDLPLPMHKNSLVAAQAGRCANEQGKFWLMREKMQDHVAKLELSDLLTYAEEVGVPDTQRFRQCVGWSPGLRQTVKTVLTVR